MSTKQEKKQRPVFAKSYFPVRVAVFEFQNGDARPNYSVRLTRSFKREEGAPWETTEYLTALDLLPAARLLGEAYGVIQARLQKAYEQARDGEADELAGEEVPF